MTGPAQQIIDDAMQALLWMDEQLHEVSELLITWDGSTFRVWATGDLNGDGIVGTGDRVLSALTDARIRWDASRYGRNA
jgi:hypothetical protein